MHGIRAFVNKGENLARFLTREHSELTGNIDDIRKLLSVEADEAEFPEMKKRLEAISGLTLSRLQHCYRSEFLKKAGGKQKNVIDLLARGDIHQGIIASDLNETGEVKETIIEGR